MIFEGWKSQAVFVDASWDASNDCGALVAGGLS